MHGRHINKKNKFLLDEVMKNKLNNHVKLLDEISNVDSSMRKMDCIISASSFGEGFPNVLGEAMSLGIITLSTDIGDSKKIIGNRKFIFSSVNDLSKKIIKLIHIKNHKKKSWLLLKKNFKERIEKKIFFGDNAKKI